MFIVWLVFVVSSYPQRWWRRVYDEEFYPTVHLGNTFLDSMITQYGLKVYFNKRDSKTLNNYVKL